MISAFVLINSASGKEKQVLNELKDIPGIKDIHTTFGAYDLILRVEEENSDLLKKTILEDIRPTKDIKATLTLFIIK